MNKKYLTGKTTFTLRYNKRLHDRLKMISICKGRTVTSLMVNAVENYIKDYEEKIKK